MLIAQPAFPHYVDTDGTPITSGSLYYGSVGANPRTSPVAIYWDAAGTQPAPQPVRTVAGYPVRNGSPANVYINGAYSVALYNAAGELVFYAPDSASFDAVLSSTTVFSRQILSVDDEAEARALFEVPKADEVLPLSGGTMTGKIVLDGNATAALNPVPKQQFDASVRPDLSSLTVTVAANAMTCSLPAETLNFRSATLTDGAAVTRTASASTLTVPSGATLGTTNGVAARIAWGWIDNAGTPEPFVVNVGGTANLDETTLISTTAISGSSNSVNTFYSQTARSNVAFRIRGWCDITEATAGTWATAPTKVQGASIQSMKPIQGRGRVPQNVLASRTFGVTYYNTTGYEIFAHVNIQWTSGSGAARLTVDGINFDGPVLSAVNQTSPVSAPVPPGGAYIFNGTNSIGFTILGWNESR